VITPGGDSNIQLSVSVTRSRPVPDDAAFREVFDQHAPFVWRCVRRLGVSDGDVEDICQEVFVVVHRKLAQFDGKASIRSWLYGICIRKVWDYRRLAHKKRERVTDEPPEGAVAPEQPEQLDRRAARELLDRLLDKLDPKQRAAFVLYEIEQLPMTEVAEALDCPLQTAYSRLHAARKQVQAAAERERARRLVS